MRLASFHLFPALQGGSAVVTPSPLLASVAMEQFNRAQLADGRQAWERPAIYSLDAWLTNCWQEARFSRDSVPALLSPLQERELWRQVIEADRPDLFDPGAMANLARRSARILAEYEIPLDADDWDEREDSRRFRDWLRKLRGVCKRNSWMVGSDLLHETSGAVFMAVNTSFKPSVKTEALEFECLADELEFAARSARELVEAGETSIAVFVPELARNNALVRRIFDAAFYPGGREEACAYHMNGHPLAQEPVIAGALLLLELLKPRTDHAVAGAILRSPFVTGAIPERSLRALADVKLRRERELDVTLDDMRRAAADCPQMLIVLSNVGKILSGKRLFGDLVKACGWPQNELMDKWNDALAELSTLGLINPEMDLNTAISRLRDILSRPVQIGDWSSPVQILDATGAGGVEFDHAFAAGLGEEGFLRPSALPPLLPFRLQRRHGVPPSSVEGLAVFASATKLRATFSGELPAMVKPFVKKAIKGKLSKRAFEAAALEQIEDGTAPRLSSAEPVRGGANVIKAQSQCPFKAFAEYRLQARPPEDACFGYDARDRGGFTHKALEFVWKELGSQANLKAMPYDELKGVVKDCILQTVKNTPQDGPLHRLASIAERQRLEALILGWLEVEKERQKTFVVEHVEQTRYYEAPGLRLDLRVDRIDRLANGSAVLIDYKTGRQSKEKLIGLRPKEPQLLVYAAALGEPVEGLVFGEMTAGDPRGVGHAYGKHFKGGGVKDHKNGWDDFLDAAKEKVAGLAAEFVAGDAVVRPLAGACSYCTSKPLCRISETGRLDEDDD